MSVECVDRATCQRPRSRPNLDERFDMADRTCSVDGCNRQARARGMCNRHYENVRLRGAAVPIRDRPDESFLSRHVVSSEGCWEYVGGRNEAGYGIIRGRRAHRVAWEAQNGPIPPGMVVRHRCDNPPCVNLTHLELGTPADNVKDMVTRGRHYMHSATHCRQGHELAGQPRPPGDRCCWVCYVAWCERHGRQPGKVWS